MTGRDLIMYILSNNLEDEPIFKDGRLLGFLLEDEAARKCGVGTATIQTWISRGYIPAIKIYDKFYIPAGFTIFGQTIK